MILPNSPIENLELLAKQVVEGFIIGLHKSPFHGFSVEFAEHRLYNRGDEMRHIDWRVFGRTDRLFVKKFEEETNLRACLLVDTSLSMYFPKEGGQASKIQFACVAAASLARLLRRQLDAAALGLFDQSLYYLSAARSAPSHLHLLTSRLQQVLDQPSTGQGSHIAGALHEAADRMHRRSLIIVFSDMLGSDGDPEALFAGLQHLKYNRHEVILFQIMDRQKELDFQFENRPYEFEDAETGEKLKLQPAQIRQQYLSELEKYQQEMTHRCHQYGIDRVLVDLSEPVEKVLHAFLLKRARMM